MKLDAWTLMAPHARVELSASPDLEEAMLAVPGVKQKQGAWLVPGNAVRVVSALIARHEVTPRRSTWVVPSVPAPTWEQTLEALVAGGEVRPWVLNGFLQSFQEEAVAFGWKRTGCVFWHSTGCGKTLSGLLCSLSLPGRVLVITKSAVRLQFAKEITRFLDLDSPPFVVRAKSSPAPLRVRGESYAAWLARHRGLMSRAELRQAWAKHKVTYGVDARPSLEDYLAKTKTRPFTIASWEALTQNLADLMLYRPTVIVFDELQMGKGKSRYDALLLPELPGDPVDRLDALQLADREARAAGGFIKHDPITDRRTLFLPTANRATAAAHLARLARKRIGLTAASIEDRPRDLWAQLDTLEPNAWGNSSAFRTRYAAMGPGRYGGMDDRGKSNVPELRARLKYVAHEVPIEVAYKNLAKMKRRQSFYVTKEDLSPPAPGFATELKQAAKVGATAVLECKLMQTASQKRNVVKSIIEPFVTEKGKVLLFTGRRRDCDALGKSLERTVKTWVVHGGHSIDARQAAIDEYMDHPGPCVLIGTGQAIGTGTNLHDTDLLLLVMLPVSPGQLKQWEGRPVRLGQKRACIIGYLIAEGTVDEHMASILIDKLPAVEELTGDSELAAASEIIAGIDSTLNANDFAESILALLDE